MATAHGRFTGDGVAAHQLFHTAAVDGFAEAGGVGRAADDA